MWFQPPRAPNASWPVARAFASGVAMEIGGRPTMVMFGGRQFNICPIVLADVWFLDTSYTWTNVTDLISGPSPGPRYAHTAVVLGNRMYVFGGIATSNCTVTLSNVPLYFGSPVGDLSVFDPATMSWSSISPQPDAPWCSSRGFHIAAAITVNHTQVMLVAGGMYDYTGFISFSVRNDTWIYAPDAGSWQPVPQATPQPFYFTSSAAVTEVNSKQTVPENKKRKKERKDRWKVPFFCPPPHLIFHPLPFQDLGLWRHHLCPRL
jgi:hypothetical protein